MSNGFVYLRPIVVVYARARGDYAVSSLEAWRRMLSWLDTTGMRREIGRGFGLLRDDPHSSRPEDRRYDACVELVAGYEDKIGPDLSMQRIPGGAYYRGRHVGVGHQATMKRLRDEVVPQKGFIIDAKRPFVEIYFDDPADVEPERRRVDVCLPVSVASGASTQRLAG